MDSLNTGLQFSHEFNHDLEFRSHFEKFKCFRVFDEQGVVVNKNAFVDEYLDSTSPAKLKKMFETMVKVNESDRVFAQAQRQSRVSFYMTGHGEEASVVGSVANVLDEDLIFPQYREQACFIYRGFTLEQMANQMVGNYKDLGKGRQMPIHYGSKDLNISTVSSTLCTQVPNASGAGYNFRIKDEDRIAMTYFGEGAASEGDFHSALNFASTLRCQTLFICRNNGYAISTPIDDQYAGDGIAPRGSSYGMPTIRVDGNDIMAVSIATKRAREIIMKEKRPALIETMSYRGGDHSSSDASATYRNEQEMKKWQTYLKQIGDPISRFEKFLVDREIIKEDYQAEVRDKALKEVRDALKSATNRKLPSIDTLFEDVYENMPAHLQNQRLALKAHLKKYADQYDLDQYQDGTEWPQKN